MGKFLITGGNGFVGSHLVNILAKEHSLIVFDRASVAEQIAGVAYIRGDLTNYGDLTKIGNDFDGIVHLGGISRVKDGIADPIECININVMGTAYILEWARKQTNAPWIVLASTVEEPANIYGLSKHVSELLTQRYVCDYGLRVLAVRFTNIYGSPYDNPDKVLNKIVAKALADEPVDIHRPNRTVGYVHYSDVIQTICAAIDKFVSLPCPFYTELYVGNLQSLTLAAIASGIVELCNSKSKIRLGRDASCAGNRRRPKAELKRTYDFLGFTASVTLEQGLLNLTDQHLCVKVANEPCRR